MDLNYFLPVFYAFIACLGFGGMCNLHGKHLLWASLGGAIGWFVYLLVLYYSSVYPASFVCAAVVAVYSEVLARIQQCTVTTFLLMGIIPMVPGAGIFHTMEYCIQGDTANFVDTGLQTFGVAASLAIGILVIDSTWRMIRILQRKRS